MKKRGIKTALTVSLLAVATTLAAAEKKGALGSAFQALAGEDQVEFVRAVNESMKDYRASSPEKRLQTIYAVNRDAVRSAPEADRKAVLAEVYATAPFDALPMITDRFAAEVFNRKSAGFSDKDDSFTEFAAAALMRVHNRVARMPVSQRPGARSVFALIMILKASEGKPEDLRQSMLFYVLTGSHELARKEWIPAELGDDGKPPSYQPILEAGYKGEEPEHVNAHPMGHPELANLQVGSDLRVQNAKDISSPKPLDSFRGLPDGVTGAGIERVPRAAANDPDSPWYRRRRGDQPGSASETYMGQGL